MEWQGTVPSMMSRREALGALGSVVSTLRGGPAAPAKSVFPPRLQKGDLVAIVAPAGAAGEKGLEQAAKNVESLGLRVKIGPNAGHRWGYLAGTDEERAADLNQAFRDPNVRGIITLRGGYGSMRILPMLDYAAFAADPKVVMGYSDITGLLNAITRKTGVVTYHGPIAEAKFEGFEGEWMRHAIFAGDSFSILCNPMFLQGRAVVPAARTVEPGKAKGRLVGGNLSLVSPCAGTPYGPDFRASILFLEDINEHPYRVDRMLTGLWLGGHLQQVRGIVLGDFSPPEAELDEDNQDFTLDQVFDHLRMWTKVPIFSGLYAGHIKDKLTLPIGAMVELDADERILTVLGT